MKRPEVRYARNGDARIAYQVTGHGSFDLVLVTGFPSNLDLHWEEPGYAHLMRRLAAFSRLIHFDQRGSGLSDRGGVDALDLATRVDDLCAVMDAAGSGRATLLGVSHGAPVALLFAATHPEKTRSLVLFGGYANFLRDVMDAGAHERFVALVSESWGSSATLSAFAPGRVSDPLFADWWARLERHAAGPAAAVALVRAMAQLDIDAVLARIAVPTLVIHRAEDVHVPASAGRDLARGIPGAEFRELAGRDHPAWTGNVDALADAIESALTGQSAAAAPRRMLAALVALRLTGGGEQLEVLADTAARGEGGLVVVTAPESCVMRFETTGAAFRAAKVAILSQSRVAAGLHAGEVEAEPESASGPARAVAEALAAAAKPGETLVSRLAAELAQGSGEQFAPHAPVAVAALSATTEALQLVPERHLEARRPIITPPPVLDRLSSREAEVLALVAEGLSNLVIAARLGLSEHTVKRHVANILTKLDLPTRAAAAAAGARVQS